MFFFLFPGNSLFFYTFGKKTSVCVKRLFFFSASGKKTDFSKKCVSRVKLFQEKKKSKKQKNPGKKKKTQQNRKVFIFCVKFWIVGLKRVEWLVGGGGIGFFFFTIFEGQDMVMIFRNFTIFTLTYFEIFNHHINL